jgi:hypothetical protein
MAEDSGKGDGITLKAAIPWVLTLVTAGFGIWQFTAEQAQGNRVPFLTEQLKLAFEASDTAARLARTSGDSTGGRSASSRTARSRPPWLPWAGACRRNPGHPPCLCAPSSSRRLPSPTLPAA